MHDLQRFSSTNMGASSQLIIELRHSAASKQLMLHYLLSIVISSSSRKFLDLSHSPQLIVTSPFQQDGFSFNRGREACYIWMSSGRHRPSMHDERRERC